MLTALEAHMGNTSNPHGVTPAQIGAAAAAHTHAVSDIVSGILSVAHGGTGVSSLSALAAAMGVGKITTGSYTGTGTYGAGSPTVVNFGIDAKLVILSERATNGVNYISVLPMELFKLSSNFGYPFPLYSNANGVGAFTRSASDASAYSSISIYSSLVAREQFNDGSCHWIAFG